MNKTNKTQILVMSALLAALCCIATMVIKIPLPFKGYLNLGDSIVLLASWMLPPQYSFLAAGLGSALADIFSGYVTYAPATFIIKGLMALAAYYIYKILKDKIGNLWFMITGGILAEVIMVLGYFVFEGFLYGFIPSMVNIPMNSIQGIAGIVVGTILINIFKKIKPLL
jgi:uncharacterized membrane protein